MRSLRVPTLSTVDTTARSRWLFVASLLALLVVHVPLLGPSLLGQQVFAETGLVLRFEPWVSTADPADLTGVTAAHDTMDSGLPLMHVFKGRLADGDFPVWTPWVGGGAPLGSVPEQALLSPLSLPYLVLPFELGPGYVRLLEVVVAVGFLFLFLRRLGLLPGPALLGGLVYSCTAFLVLWNNWPQAQVAALIPALFWSTERLLALRRPSAAVPVALVVATMLLASFPAVLVYSLYLLGPYVLVRTLATRPRLRTVAASWALSAAGLVLGVALAGFQVLPFLLHLGEVDLSYREQQPTDHLPFSSLLTLAAPYAFGSETDGTFFGYRNAIEAIAYVGVVCLVLCLCALCLRVPVRVPRGVTVLMAGTVGTLVLVAWSSEALLGVVQSLPFLGSSFIGRTRAVLAFALAVLAAIGAERLVRLDPGSRPLRWSAVLPVVAAAGALAWALRGARAAAAEADRTEVLLRALVLPSLVLGAVVLAVAVAVAVRQGRAGRLALLVLPALVAVEGLAFVAPRWPSEDPSQLYPRTGVHEFLAGHLDGERYAAAGGVMFPSTTNYYRLRAVSGHAFPQPTWKQVLQRVDPEVRQGPTLSFVGGSERSARSPLLDRLAARYFVASLSSPVFGSLTPPPPSTGAVVLRPGGSLRVPLDPGPRRALVLPLTAATTGAAPGRLVATFRDAAGSVVGTAVRENPPVGRGGTLHLPVAGESGPLTRAVEAELGVEGVVLHLGVAASGRPAVGEVRPAADGLVLAYARESVVYERTSALPRVRFASTAVRVPDGPAALDVLASGRLADDEVVLTGPAAATPGGGRAALEVVEDSGDVLRVRSEGTGPGWLVVADALQQSGWEAEVDGRRVPLLHADHAAVAVPLAGGEHEVRLRYVAPGLRAGSVLSGAALLALLALAVAGRRRGPKPLG